MIYTAYAKALGLPFDANKMEIYFNSCVEKIGRDYILINRHPKQEAPPLSFDECMGASYLGLLPYDALKGNHFVYYGHGQRLGSDFFARLLLAFNQAIMPKVIVKGWTVKVKKPNWRDRNAWWEKNMVHVKYFAARLTPDKTYVLKKFNDRSFHIEEEKFYAIARDCMWKSGRSSKQDNSTRNLWWLMFIMNKDYNRARSMKPWINFESYFGSDHDFTKAIKKMYGIK
jgi:hypothetical protein